VLNKVKQDLTSQDFESELRVTLGMKEMFRAEMDEVILRDKHGIETEISAIPVECLAKIHGTTPLYIPTRKRG
jgi:hypothetical protein